MLFSSIRGLLCPWTCLLATTCKALAVAVYGLCSNHVFAVLLEHSDGVADHYGVLYAFNLALDFGPLQEPLQTWASWRLLRDCYESFWKLLVWWVVSPSFAWGWHWLCVDSPLWCGRTGPCCWWSSGGRGLPLTTLAACIYPKLPTCSFL